MSKKILTDAEELKGIIKKYRRDLHKIPEIGLNLPKTKQYVFDALEQMGYVPKEPCNNTIIVKLGKGEGKTFLIRADMDALSVQEETGLSFAADNGNMHACGHDCHAAMLLGAAQILKNHEDEIEGTIKLLFQPGEETMEGAKQAVEAGIVDDVNAAMMCHVVTGMNELPYNKFVVFEKGPAYASVDWFKISVKGKGGHGAVPELSINPITILNAIYTFMPQIITEEVTAAEQAVLSVGEIHAGRMGNVIPDTGYMVGTIRTFDEEVREIVKKKLAEQVDAIARMKGGSAEIEFFSNAPCAVADQRIATSVWKSITESQGEDAAELSTYRTGASEDFAYIAQKVPSAILWFVIGTPDEGYCYPCHHPKAIFNEELLYKGSAAFASAAIDWLKNNK